MHDLGGGIFQGILQVVLEVAEELPGSSLHHIQQPSSVASIHVWGQRTFSHQDQKTNKKQKQIQSFYLSSDLWNLYESLHNTPSRRTKTEEMHNKMHTIWSSVLLHVSHCTPVCVLALQHTGMSFLSQPPSGDLRIILHPLSFSLFCLLYPLWATSVASIDM